VDKKYTLKEASFRLGLHWRTVYRWTLEGTIAYIQYKINGPIYISENEIERICKEKIAPKFPQ
jgi:predicted site-specific integrase-resolvase